MSRTHLGPYKDSIFPVPYSELEPVKPSACRVVQQRGGRVRAVQRRANDTLRGLNWMAGRGEPAPGEEASDVQSEVRARVFARVVARGPPPAGLDGPSSLRAMLKGRDDYEGSDVQVAPFRLDRVALPGSMRDGPLLRDITSPEVRQVLDDLVGELLLPDVEAEAALATAGVTPYTDPALIQSRCRYRQLVTELDRRGLIHWSRRPRERVGVFFAAKKHGKLRMIIDCRRTN